LTDTGYVWAITIDGLPLDEPWRGAATDYRDSDLPAEQTRAAIDQAWGHR
jgi:hypothetical protein